MSKRRVFDTLSLRNKRLRLEIMQQRHLPVKESKIGTVPYSVRTGMNLTHSPGKPRQRRNSISLPKVLGTGGPMRTDD